MKRSETQKKGRGKFILIGLVILGCLSFFSFRHLNELRLERKGEETLKSFVSQLSKGKYDDSLAVSRIIEVYEFFGEAGKGKISKYLWRNRSS